MIQVMTVRADFSSELQLERVEAEAVDTVLRSSITEAITHLRSGRGGHRRGGKKLIDLLSKARKQAAGVGEWHVVRLLQDSVDYAEGRITKATFEEMYLLFQDGKRNEINRDFISRIMETVLRYALSMCQRFLAEQPEATSRELMAHLESLLTDAALLDAPKDRPGRYRILRGRAETAVWLERKLRDRIDVEDASEAARRIVMSPEALTILAEDSDGQTLLRTAELRRRATGLAQLRTVAEDPTATEQDLQEALEGQHWIFGGRFVGDEPTYRRLVAGDEYDIPLIRADGSLFVVELKLSMKLKEPLVKRHRGSWVAAAAVNDAMSQAVNYLVGLDENRLRIRDEAGIETRRASAMVLIGHPACQPEAPEEAIHEALRILNTHINRVEVLTYKELIDNAERSIGGPG
jgi:hypothetical protein